MNKLLLITALGFIIVGCAAQEEAVKAYHPTDDISAQSQGGKGFTADGSEVQLEAPEPVKAFHPTCEQTCFGKERRHSTRVKNTERGDNDAIIFGRSPL